MKKIPEPDYRNLVLIIRKFKERPPALKGWPEKFIEAKKRRGKLCQEEQILTTTIQQK